MKLQQMRAISNALLSYIHSLQEGELLTLLTMKDYHGFKKSRFPDQVMESILAPFGLSLSEVQAELVVVETDLRHEVHVHHQADAAITILGAQEHLDEPVAFSAFLVDHWFPVVAGQELDFPAGTAHGLTVEEGGYGPFLSVQSPPIEREDGHDDYEKVSA